jgi:hypothetical protein
LDKDSGEGGGRLGGAWDVPIDRGRCDGGGMKMRGRGYRDVKCIVGGEKGYIAGI